MNNNRYVLIVLRAAILLLLLSVPPSFGAACYDCHSAWEEGADAPTSRFTNDVHHLAGLGCADCHGGDPSLEDMEEVRESENYRGIPETEEIPQFCARCHGEPGYMVQHQPGLPTDQLEKYKTSVHGHRLFEEGDTRVATCVSCHSAHRIETAETPTSTVNAENLPGTCAECHANEDYMAEYGIPTDQYADYVESVHGRALLVEKDHAAPACNDCHGNHAATPPGVTSLSDVCGVCHSLVAENFANSPHKPAFDAMGLAECEICHSNHRIVSPETFWVGTSDSSLCIDCHYEGEDNAGFETAARINELLRDIEVSYSEAERRIAEADKKGMMVTDERLTLKEARQAMIRAGTEVHTFDASQVREVVTPGIEKAVDADSAAAAKIDNYYFRRKGLGVATLLITILAIALYVKIRRIEK